MKITRADYYFSLFIRSRDGWVCQRCGASDPPRPAVFYKSHLQNSHYFGRTMLPVRFDEDNCDTLCHGCHRYWEKEDREGYRAFKIKQLGESRYNRLDYRAHKGSSPDRFFISLYYYKKLTEMGTAVPINPEFDKLLPRLLVK